MLDRSQSGFSYIDVMIAIVILTIGVLALLAGISTSVIQTRNQEQQMQAKQIASSTMESILSVKETDPTRLGWPAVGNVGTNPDSTGVNRGIFLTGNQPVYLNAGGDEVLGTADDTGAVVAGFQRSIVITDLCDPSRPSPNCTPPGTSAIRMRSVAVTVTYAAGGLQRQEVLRTVLTDYAVSN